MRRAAFFIVTLGVLCVVSAAYAVTPSAAKYGGLCAYSLSQGEKVATDCSIYFQSPNEAQPFCFSSEQAKSDFAEDLEKNTLQAEGEFKKSEASSAGSEGAGR